MIKFTPCCGNTAHTERQKAGQPQIADKRSLGGGGNIWDSPVCSPHPKPAGAECLLALAGGHRERTISCLPRRERLLPSGGREGWRAPCFPTRREGEGGLLASSSSCGARCGAAGRLLHPASPPPGVREHLRRAGRALRRSPPQEPPALTPGLSRKGLWGPCHAPPYSSTTWQQIQKHRRKSRQMAQIVGEW